MSTLRVRFDDLLGSASAELYSDNRNQMASPDLVPTANVIDEGDLELFFAGVDAHLIRLERGGKFNTYDRPKAGGRWSLLSRSKAGGWYNAEYLPQLAAYVDAIQKLGYPKDRVLFELPSEALQLDLAILNDAGQVVVLGEAKRDARMLSKLVDTVADKFSDEPPDETSKKRGDEARQLAWRLWTARPTYCWLIAPGLREAYECSYEPLRLASIGELPPAGQVGLADRPPHPLQVPRLQ